MQIDIKLYNLHLISQFTYKNNKNSNLSYIKTF